MIIFLKNSLFHHILSGLNNFDGSETERGKSHETEKHPEQSGYGTGNYPHLV
ncbi:hypothetical protein MTBBW1_2270008 [Desulfamplus magnetovallimortis]|uniref:Uncharacterized protein n=1 Tax=Desulfamplus magnetovallimortis TaxID=1246637 RepID=A0A1W1HD88_9BACT|nr:hypothetical protein MTBBW1_2270008 [Desulfamplus magnetovallimortis]